MNAPAVIPLHQQSIGWYIRQGWKLCAIPPGTKGPQQSGWNEADKALMSADQLPDGWGVGLMHSLSGTCAIDIDDYALAKAWLAERGVDLDVLMRSPDAVGIESGNPGHGKLLYRVPLGMPLPSKRVVVEREGVRRTILELRCAAASGKSVQDVLPPSKHPAGTTYQWTGSGSWQSLPVLPVEMMGIWQDLLAKDAERSLPMEKAAPANMDEVRSAIFAIDPNCDRRTWVEVGMALKDAAVLSGQLEYGLQLFDEWSSGSVSKYKPAEIVPQWASFKVGKPDGITVASLFHHAHKAGWKRPQCDVTGMFSPIQDVQPVETVKARLTTEGKAPSVDLAMWPDRLVRRAVEVASEVGCDPVVPLVAGLCAISGAMDKRISLKISESWRVPPILWFMTVGEPSDKKTPGSKPMFHPLRRLEAEDRPRFEAAMLVWQGKEARHAAQLKAYREFEASPESGLPNSQLPAVEVLPPKPEPLRLIINDATTQKVVTLSEQRPRGMLLWMDEMNGWLTSLSNPRGTDNRSTWVQCYEGGPYTMDRVGAGSIWVDNLALSFYGNCQPEVLRKNVAGASSDGLLQRFMPIVLDAAKTRVWRDSVPSFMSFEHDYEQLVIDVHRFPVTAYELSPEARAAFHAFCEWTITLRGNERLIQTSSSYNTALGKLEGHCARLMLVLHAIEAGTQPFVSRATADRAIGLVRRFFYPMLRYTFLTVAKQRDEVGRLLVDFIIQCASAKPIVTMADLRRATKSVTGVESYDMKTDFALRSHMEDLMVDGWVSYFQDHPKQPQFAINPELANIYAEHRQAIIRAKQSMIESMAEEMNVTIRHTAIGWTPEHAADQPIIGSQD